MRHPSLPGSLKPNDQPASCAAVSALACVVVRLSIEVVDNAPICDEIRAAI